MCLEDRTEGERIDADINRLRSGEGRRFNLTPDLRVRSRRLDTLIYNAQPDARSCFYVRDKNADSFKAAPMAFAARDACCTSSYVSCKRGECRASTCAYVPVLTLWSAKTAEKQPFHPPAPVAALQC